MNQIVGDLFELFDTGDYDAIVIPVNATLDRNQELVMGAGVALAAKERWPWLPTASATRTDWPVYTFRIPKTEKFIVHFRTKKHWRTPSTEDMVRKSAAALRRWVDYKGVVSQVVMPRVGCGLGGLAWIDVERILKNYLDERFYVVEMPE